METDNRRVVTEVSQTQSRKGSEGLSCCQATADVWRRRDCRRVMKPRSVMEERGGVGRLIQGSAHRSQEITAQGEL